MYNDDTSAVTRREPCGRGGTSCIFRRKSLVSLMLEGNLEASGVMKWVT